MYKSILTILLLVAVTVSYAQKNDRLYKDLSSGIALFNDSKDMDGMVEAVRVCKALSDQNASKWLPAFWTSFMYTQIGRQTQQQLAYYDSAQFYLDKALAMKEFNNEMKSELMAVQSLIHGLRSGPYWSKNDRTNAMKYVKLEQDALNNALKLNANNPRVYLLSGTDMISTGMRNNDFALIVAGKKMLESADKLFQSKKPYSDIHPSWGQGWVGFWLARADSNLPKQGGE